MARAFIAVGSNIEPEKNIRQALGILAGSVGLISISTFYQNPAITKPEQPLFYNGVVAIQTDISPTELKRDVLRPIEATLGRHRSADKYASRQIDLDLILYDQCVLQNPDLKLPDPNILEAAFVAIPLCELAPELVLPGSQTPISQVARQLQSDQMEPLNEFTRKLRTELLGSR